MRGVANRLIEKELPSPIPTHPAEHHLTPERIQRFRQVLARRTGRLAVVVEECHDPQNATAVIRTCDALGIHRCHVVAGRNGFKVNRRVSQGSHLNLDLRVHEHIDEAYAQLKANGFRCYVTDLAADAVVGPGPLKALMAEQPLAVVFGNEGHGLSEAALAGADGRFLIPMVGFPQSLNLSVSVAMTCWTLRQEALEGDLPGDLAAEEQCHWFDVWVRRQKTAAKAMDDAAAEDARSRSGVGRRGEDLAVYGGKEAADQG
jgi:tRNA (guanosine-2'-O-)-methyltransferase